MSIDSGELKVTHKFRAECPLDVAWFILNMNEACLNLRTIVAAGVEAEPHCVVILVRMMGRLHWEVHLSSNLSLEQIRQAMQEVTGGALMLATVSRAEDYRRGSQ